MTSKDQPGKKSSLLIQPLAMEHTTSDESGSPIKRGSMMGSSN